MAPSHIRLAMPASPSLPHVAVFIATSLDGFIARPDGGLDWLPGFDDGEDYGYAAFIDGIDVLMMGRKSFEAARGFEPWPYGGTRVVVLSTGRPEIPEALAGSAAVRCGEPRALLEGLAAEGVRGVYLDGGETIQRFLSDDLVDELIVTRVPVLLGAGRPLFGPLPEDRAWVHVETRAYDNGLVQSRYRRP